MAASSITPVNLTTLETPVLISIGTNAALQKLLYFTGSFNLNQVNRAHQLDVVVGGKGQNCAKAANSLVSNSCYVAQFLGGRSGDLIEEKLTSLNVPQLTIRTQGTTRTCTTLLAEERNEGAYNSVTEIVGPSEEISDEERNAFLQLVGTEIQQDHIQGIAICGSFPPGFAVEDYVTLVEHCIAPFVLLDSVKQTHAVLLTGRVNLFKVNEQELDSFLNISSPSMDLDTKVKSYFFERFNVPWLGISLGSEGGVLYSKEQGQKWTFRLPSQLPQMKNTIGAGDTMNGAFLVQHCILRQDIVVSFGFGLACATAKCTNALGGGHFDIELATQIQEQMVIENATF